MSSIQNKKLAKNTAFLYIRMIVVLTVSLFTTRVILQNLGVEDYGIYNVVGSVVSLFYFLQTAMSSANYRFMAVAIGKDDMKGLSQCLQNAFIIGLIVAFLIFILGETIGLYYINNFLNVPHNRFDASVFVFHISIISCIVQCASMVYYSLIIAREKMNFFAILSIFECCLKITIAILVGISPIDRLEFYAMLMLGSNFVVFLVYHLYCRSFLYKIAFSIYQHINRVQFKKMIGFSGWTLFVTLADISVTSGLNIMINAFFSPVVNAARGVVVQIQGAVDQFRGNLQTALNPQITKQYAIGARERMFNLMSASGRYSTYILLLIAIPICIASEEILAIWLHEVPPYTSIFLNYVLASCIIDGMSNPFVTAIGATGDIKKFQFLVGLTKLLTVPFAYLALKNGGSPVTLFQVFTVMTIVTVGVRIFICSRKVHLPLKIILKVMFLPSIMVAIISTILSLFLYHIISPATLLQLIFFVLCTLFANSLIVWAAGLNSSERTFCIQFLKAKFIK